ncbi:unnamed protein product [Zymoseptoria tritici ST99CH_1E4]|uniref:amidase n=1 Tax=Zymoseptoria tritici ST99CH_1E4 TaxID=1276532 RepID=A0A2H1GBK2_ZYMTR|nr:unnamed protein product [Zymoseptoria tritici ST99CH_1E4]
MEGSIARRKGIYAVSSTTNSNAKHHTDVRDAESASRCAPGLRRRFYDRLATYSLAMDSHFLGLDWALQWFGGKDIDAMNNDTSHMDVTAYAPSSAKELQPLTQRPTHPQQTRPKREGGCWHYHWVMDSYDEPINRLSIKTLARLFDQFPSSPYPTNLVGEEAAGQAKAKSLLDLIPSEWRISSIPSAEQQRDVTGDYIQQYLSQSEIKITETDAVDIVQKTSSGEWKAEEVAKAFCHRAAVAHQLTSCLHEIFFDAAIEDAKKLDQFFRENKKPIGPLHGLPVSLKDQFHVKDVETSMGYVGWLGTFEGKKGTGKEKKFESEMVKELRALGATLYVKTSVPHTLMCGETINNIIGYTQNPKNRNLSSGGSSGGEGALIGARGSVVGFGTDIGGSIRIPAAFNGLYGIRPSTGRLPYEGMANSMDGQNSILSVVGPLATTASGLRLVTEALLSTQPWLHDPLVHEIPWRSEASKLPEKLSFAVLRHDGSCAPMPPVSRAIEIAVKAMQDLGHEVIEWKPDPPHAELTKICVTCWGFDGGADCRHAFALSGEPSAPQVIVDQSEQANASDIMAANVTKRELQKRYMEYWNSTAKLAKTGRPVDAIICPLAPFPAARPEGFLYYGYSVFVNVLDYTSVVVPVTNVDKKVDVKRTDYTPVNETDRKVQENYDPEIFDGAHVSIQLVGRRLQEEKMIALADYVGKALHG